MTCCAPGAEAAAELAAKGAPETDDEALTGAAHRLEDGRLQLELAIPDAHCAACMSTIERALKKLDMVDNARVNLSTKRVRIAFTPGKGLPSDLTRAIAGRGYRVFLLDPDADGGPDKTYGRLVRSLAVAGFAAGNIMLLSVSIWSGADEVTRNLFHWVSALIAIPAVAYAGQPFFRSAVRALRHGALNMDVPIALAVLLALGMSIAETMGGGEEAYFDASVTLLFFLLIGRTLDHLMREKARGAVRNLARLAPRGATQLHEGGRREHVDLKEITPGMILELAAGERVPVDGEVISGNSEVDLSHVTGESVPEPVAAGSRLLAGTANLSGVIALRASKPASESFLARMIGLMEAAEGSKAGYKRIADRAAAIYAPAVHILSFATLIGWGFLTGDWHMAVINAIAVLIITCPCALGLAVPIVHVVASGRLFEAGVMMRDGVALERLAEIRRVVFDKTGTLSEGRPVFAGQTFGVKSALKRAAQLAVMSRHPFSRALAGAAPDTEPMLGEFTEIPGQGVEAVTPTGVWRFGRAAWCGVSGAANKGAQSEVWLSHDGEPVAGFAFADTARPDAGATIAALKKQGVALSLLSGDREGPVMEMAGELGIADAHANLTPAGKLARLQGFSEAGEKVLMVGDGINDAPALRAAHASMAPSSAADVGRNAADFIFTRDSLMAVPHALGVARAAARAVKENFGLAIAYNMIAVPLAVSGQVTPLIAALAMSSSSIIVTLNALKLRLTTARSARLASRPAAATGPGKLAAAE